ncbi:MAG: condensation domain-containing protein, partial [archaeon]|nr:condensation domain-containing protein [archaeon]
SFDKEPTSFDKDLDYYKKEIRHEDPAVILYTSGSTGKPKGVMLSHGGIINFSRWLQDEVNLSAEDKVSAYASFGFDAHMIDIYSSLISGSQLYIVGEDVRKDILPLTDFLAEKKITVGFFTTRIAHILNSLSHNLRIILTGGEKIQPLDIENYQLINGYGPTECTIYSTYYKAEGHYDGTVIGRPLPNYQLLIIDKNKNLVPQGVPGELLIAGKGLSFGYLNRPELNEEKFIDFKLNEDIRLKAYRTGDLVRYDENGNIVFIGRDDKLIKLRGYRIELDEIEQRASYYTGIKEVAAKVKNDHLCLYYTSKLHISQEELKAYLSKYLPDYMVPHLYLQMEKFPYNLNSKIDRDQLPDIAFERERAYEAPQGLFENAIAGGFSSVLGLHDPVSRFDEFAALGGDSISVMMLVGILRRYNIELSVKDVLDAQSVKEIAKRAKYKISLDKVSQETYEGFVDSTPITKHFFDSDFNKPSYFNQAFLFEANGRIDKEILKKSMRAIMNHHDLLRAKVKDEKLFIREISDEDYFTIETCETLDYARETERINNEIDIENDELIKLAIFEDEPNDNLYIVIHHLIVDGISWRIIVEDLNLAYAQSLKGEEIVLPEKTSSYQDYALAIKKYRGNEEVQNQKEYWDKTISTLKKIKHTKIDSHIRKMEKFDLKFLNKKTMNLFGNCSKYYNASTNALLLSALSKSWNDVLGEDELSLRLEGHGREDFDKNIIIDRTVGWFTTAYPLILKCAGENFKELIGNIQKTLDAVPQHGFSYPILMGIETEELPLVTFNYLGEMSKVRTGEMFVTVHRADLAYYTSPENNYGSDVNINCYSINSELHFNLEYNSERFSEEKMKEFGECLFKTFDEFILSSGENIYWDDIHIFSDYPDKKNLFFIHSANYGSEFFYYIAQQLKEDYSFSVLEPYNINHKENPLSSIEEMASKYIEIIKTIQPKGPYYLGGLCFGGAIAHEMAIQLRKQGEKVDKLIIFDSHNIEDKELQNLVLEDQVLHAREYLKDGILNPSEENMEDMVYNARLASKIWMDYRPKDYDGETIYFRATIKPPGDLSFAASKMYDYVLSRKAGGYEGCYDEKNFQIIDVPVEHNNMFSSAGLEVIVPCIKRFIEEN